MSGKLMLAIGLGASGPPLADLSAELLECPHRLMAGFPHGKESKRPKQSCNAFYDSDLEVTHIVAPTRFYWSRGVSPDSMCEETPLEPEYWEPYNIWEADFHR